MIVILLLALFLAPIFIIRFCVKSLFKIFQISQRSVMPFSVFCARLEASRGELELEDQRREVSEYTRLVGGRLAADMLLYRT